MKQLHNEKTCALCSASLGWWNTQTCVKCGHTLCGRHACKKRRPHSSVLSAYCSHCVHEEEAISTSAAYQAIQHQHVHV